MLGASQEQPLLDQALRLTKHDSQYQAAYFQLSKLRKGLPSTAHIAFAQESIRVFAETHEASCYTLLGSDRVLLCPNKHAEAFENFIATLTNTIESIDESAPRDAIVNAFDLEQDAYTFYKLCEHLLEASKTRGATRLYKSDLQPLGTDDLQSLQRSLLSMDISSMLRKQKVCALTKQDKPKPVFTEYFIAMNKLRETIAPTIDLFANTRFFNELMQAVDKRLFVALYERKQTIFSAPVSFNLTLETLVYPEFVRFADSVTRASPKSLIVELEVRNVAAHLEDYKALRPFLRRLGMKVLIQGVGIEQLEAIDLKYLDADFYKLPAHLLGCRPESAGELLGEKLGDLVSSRCVLTHCSDEEAVAMGRKFGIQAFQGYYVDKRLQAESALHKTGTG